MLEFLDISGPDIRKVTDMSWMFYGCPKPKAVLVGGSWSNASAASSEGTFEGCKALVGGNGTRYSEGHAGAGYARVDAPARPAT